MPFLKNGSCINGVSLSIEGSSDEWLISIRLIYAWLIYKRRIYYRRTYNRFIFRWLIYKRLIARAGNGAERAGHGAGRP